MQVHSLLQNRSLRRGLTLIELVVVMLILAAVAGILIPLLPNMVTRAHTTTGATNVGEVAKAIQTHEAMYLTYPNNFDSLVLSGTGGLATYIPANSGADLTTVTTTTDMVDALRNAGITTMAQMINAPASNPGDFSPTFYPYGTDASVLPTATAITSGMTLASITTTAASRIFSASPTASYAVFGVGARTSMQGKTLQEAPVHFSDNAATPPGVAYSRLGVVFQLTDSAGEALERAKLVGIIAFHDDGIVGLNDHLAEYFATNQN